MNFCHKMKYGKQDEKGKAFNEHNPNTTLQQGPAASSPGIPQTKTGQDNNCLIRLVQ
jgi:hypothetical protein